MQGAKVPTWGTRLAKVWTIWVHEPHNIARRLKILSAHLKILSICLHIHLLIFKHPNATWSFITNSRRGWSLSCPKHPFERCSALWAKESQNIAAHFLTISPAMTPRTQHLRGAPPKFSKLLARPKTDTQTSEDNIEA